MATQADKDLELELKRSRILLSGRPIHEHKSKDGSTWFCCSPYCPRGGDIRLRPQAGPGEDPEQADLDYRVT